MIGQPHPVVAYAAAGHRIAAFQAEAERYRLARLVQQVASHRQAWPDVVAVVAVVLLLALLLATGSDVATV